MQLKIAGVTINYANVAEIGPAVKAELERVDGRLAKVAAEYKTLRRTRRMLQQALGGRAERPKSATAKTPSTPSAAV